MNISELTRGQLVQRCFCAGHCVIEVYNWASNMGVLLQLFLRAQPRLVKAVETIGNSLVTLILFLVNVLLTEELKHFS